jgi:hypothetical protein
MWVYDDGGRQRAGYKGIAGDCVVRAIAIITEKGYREVYDDLKDMQNKTPRSGVQKSIYKKYLRLLGFTWTPTMHIGSGCKVHLKETELPTGRVLVSLSKHLTAVIDGIIHDTYDPSREGVRCVYGYWQIR